jgi:hypothetical protein
LRQTQRWLVAKFWPSHEPPAPRTAATTAAPMNAVNWLARNLLQERGVRATKLPGKSLLTTRLKWSFTN